MKNEADEILINEIKKEDIKLIKETDLKTEEDWEKAIELENEGKAIILTKETE
jgi:hypothetical protein